MSCLNWPGTHGRMAIGINTTISIAWLIFDALVLYGISKKKPVFYIPWLIVHITSQLLWTIAIVIYFVWLAPKKRGCCDGIFYLIDDNATVLLLPHIFGYCVCFIIFSAYKKMKEENQTNYQSSCDIEMIVDATSSQYGACGSNMST